jgi:sporulation protein YqfD
MIGFDQLQLQVTSADPEGLLQAMNLHGISAFSVTRDSEISMTFCLGRGDYIQMKKLVTQRGEKLKVTGYTGLYWQSRKLLRRPILLAGILLLLCAGVFLPTRVLFIQVEGNTSLPTAYILEAAEDCGISFGASRRQLRSEKVKNRLLDLLPELQWAGVNTYGCVAVISVRQRSTTTPPDISKGISSIVASREGVIQSCIVTRGSLRCEPGQAVVKGQVLISGFTDCGLSILAQQAEGEIMALTKRTLKAVTPEKCVVRHATQVPYQKFSLILGKFRINFYKDSGILDTGCVKMYAENYMTLPGGFRLPIALVTQTIYSCELEEAVLDQTETLIGFAERYLQSQMTAGQILHRQETLDGCQLTGSYECLEMIGQVHCEERSIENEDR